MTKAAEFKAHLGYITERNSNFKVATGRAAPGVPTTGPEAGTLAAEVFKSGFRKAAKQTFHPT